MLSVGVRLSLCSERRVIFIGFHWRLLDYRHSCNGSSMCHLHASQTEMMLGKEE